MTTNSPSDSSDSYDSDNPAPLTVLAERYTHPTGQNHSVLAYTGKSGLTPLDPYPTQPPFPSAKKRKRDKALESYQIWRFLGFRTQRLVEMDAFAPIYTSQLTQAQQNFQGSGEGFVGLGSHMPIHPIYERRNWVGSRNVLCSGANDLHSQFEQAENDRVWNILEPCLRLASAFLYSAHVLTWFDALIMGDFVNIEDDIPAEWKSGKLLRFKPLQERSAARDQVIKDSLQVFADQFVFDVSSGMWNKITGRTNTPSQGFQYGITYKSGCLICIEIAFERLLPFLEARLTTPERQVDVCNIATTILHETCHAIWKSIRQDFQVPVPADPEPYLEGQPLPELGFSMSEVVLGGRAISLTGATRDPDFEWSDSGIASAGLLQTTFFTESGSNYHGIRSSKPPAVPPFPDGWGEYRDFYVGQIDYFENLNLPEFWTSVRKYGTAVTRMPRTEGRRFTWQGATGPQDLPVVSHDSEGLVSAPDQQQPLVGNMTSEDHEAAEMQNANQERNIKIKRAMELGLQQRRDAQVSIHNHEAKGESAGSPSTFVDYMFAGPPPMFTDYEDPPIPECPRFDEIRQYLEQNRAQGRLCLDTMTFWIPEHTFLAYVLSLGGMDITPEEWKDFLRVSAAKDERIQWTPWGHGEVLYRMAPDPKVPPLPNPLHLASPPLDEATVAKFQKTCLVRTWTSDYLEDFHRGQLLNLINMHMKEVPGYDETDAIDMLTLERLIDLHDKHMNDMALWCWGPGRVMRRLVDNWPQRKTAATTAGTS